MLQSRWHAGRGLGNAARREGKWQVRQKTVGLIGLGLMGQALATRLIPAGFRVLGYDIDAAKGAKLKAMGGEAASLAEVAKCGTVVLAVFSTDQVEDVVENTLVPAAGSGKIVLCTSTCDPDRIAALAARVAPKGIRFLETPVSGSSGQVSRGEGTGLIGGDPATAAEVDDILTALYPRRFHIGKVRRCRAGQARHQPDPRFEPDGAGGGDRVRLAARPRRQGIP